jgi:hypothetical protein
MRTYLTVTAARQQAVMGPIKQVSTSAAASQTEAASEPAPVKQEARGAAPGIAEAVAGPSQPPAMEGIAEARGAAPGISEAVVSTHPPPLPSNQLNLMRGLAKTIAGAPSGSKVIDNMTTIAQSPELVAQLIKDINGTPGLVNRADVIDYLRHFGITIPK